MTTLPGRPPSAAHDIIDASMSEDVVNRQQLPRLITPTPIHAGIPSLTQAGMDIYSQQLKEREASNSPLSLQLTSSLRARTDVDAILPVQGGEEDAQAAVEKLERMQKAIQSRKMWLKGSGVEGMARVATAGGKRAYTRQEKNETTGDDAESVMSLPKFGEVKLGISSLPGYPIMAAQKAKRFLSKSIPKEQESSTKAPSLTSTGEESTSLPLRKPHPLRLLQKAPNPVPVTSIAKGLNDSNSAQKVAPSSLAVSNGIPSPVAQHRSESTSLRQSIVEEPTPESTEVISETADLKDAKADKLKRLQGPRLIVQSPSDNGLLPLTEGVPLHQQTSSSSPIYIVNESSSDESQTCDDKAQTAADACQNHIARPSILSPGDVDFQDSPSSSASSSENEQGSFSSDSEGSLPTTPQEELMLNLDHGEEMTKKQKKRLLRRIRKSASEENRELQDQSKLTVMRNKRVAKRQGTLSDKMQSGLHYASSQSRNRRAMERYSPHPTRPSSTAPLGALAGYSKSESAGNLAEMFGSSGLPPTSIGEISRSSTPVLVNSIRGPGLDSRRSSISEINRPMGVDVSQMTDGSVCMSPVVDDATDREDRWGELTKSFRRQGTSHSMTSSMTGNASFRKRYFSLRRKKRDSTDLAEESDSGANTPRVDPEKELDSMLRNLAEEQSPELLEEQFEYDVLYENQRGLMFFGIPKFSSKTLFQWDPASWTNAYYEDSAYNVVNAQLPNPYWEWVHPEWMIDMTGDVDESGWQYSYNFGQLSLPVFTRPDSHISRAGVKGNAIMNERMAKRTERREEKNNSRTDEGFEALKRTARTRGARWTGIPDQNKYVRRRRWIRLRKRKALQQIASMANTRGVNTPLSMGKASGDWFHLIKEESKRREREQQRLATNPVDQASSSSSSSSSSGDSISDLESDEADSEYASQGAASSAFLPRRTPGNLEKGANDNISGKELEKLRRHAKEFTGTIRELKSLLPAILDRRQLIRPTNRQRLEVELWMSEVDARNPFIGWNLVKKRLDDDDLAFASASLRARERRHAQRIMEHRDHNSTEVNESITESSRYDLTKDAVVEINYRRVMRVMRACKVDRHKLQLWKIWLGVEPVSSITEVAREEDLTTIGIGANMGQERKEAFKQARAKWRKSFSHPDVMDVWDLLERRLDRLLLTFEYQGSRASLLRLLLTLHATSHWAHRFQPSRNNLDKVDAKITSSLSPQSSSNNLWNLAAGQGSTKFTDEWRGVGLPRLEFWSDLEKCARTLLEDGRSNPNTFLSSPQLGTHEGRTSPHLIIGRNSPPPSIIRSSTPQMMGSLANGPSARRLTTPHPPSPLQIPLTRKVPPSAASTSHPQPTTSPIYPDEGDQNFLADLLQLPVHSQQELLVKTAEQNNFPQPSSVISRLTRAVEEDEEDSPNKNDVAI